MDAKAKEHLEKLLHDGETERADQAVTAALRADAGDVDALIFRARLTAFAGELEAGLLVIERALKKDPKHPEALAFKGAILASSGQFEQALPILEAALRTQRAPASVHYNLGRCYAAAGDSDKARAHIQLAVDEQPDNAAHVYALAQLCAEADEGARAMELLTRSLELNPAHPDAWLVLVRVQLSEGQTEDALANLEQGLQHTGGNPALREERASALLLAGRSDESVEEFEKLSAEFSDNAETLGNLALAYAANGRYADAEGAFRGALQLEQNNPYLYIHLAGLLELHDSEEALEETVALLEKARTVDNTAWEPLNDLGRLLVTREGVLDPAAGLQLLEEAQRLSGGAPETLLNLAIAHARAEDMPQAKRFCADVIANAEAGADVKRMAEALLIEIG